MTKNIFTYGTLMDSEIMRAVTGRSFQSLKGTLRGYSRKAVPGHTYPGIIAAPDGILEGVIYLNVSEEAISRLDAFEGEGYKRIIVSVESNGIIPCDTYLCLNPEELESSPEWDFNYFKDNHRDIFLRQYKGWNEID